MIVDLENVKNNNIGLCPCMSKAPYQECCEPFHQGTKKAQTAEQLMRSRYTAYHLALVEYLIKTTHPDKLGPNYRSQLEKSKHDTSWKGLKIISTSMGGNLDKIGKVRFIANYEMNGKEDSMEEHSRFKRYKGDWVYFDEKG